MAREPEAPAPLRPELYRVVDSRRETEDVVTLSVEPAGPDAGTVLPFRPGQYNMLTAFGVGEVPVSVSGPAAGGGPLEHTVRDVGAVTGALCRCEPGDLVGVRGPFGTDWGVDGMDPDDDAVVVAGGIGLAPLRRAVYDLARRAAISSGRVHVLIGARRPEQVMFGADIARWREAGAHVAVTVDVGGPGWRGHVGLVTALLADAGFDPVRTTALVCGPEVMMRFTARALIDAGVDHRRIRVSAERNMQCGVAWCGHCQLGPFLLCRDGPVLPYADLAPLLMERER